MSHLHSGCSGEGGTITGECKQEGVLETFLGSSLLRKEHSCALAHSKELLQFLDFSLVGLWLPQLWEEGNNTAFNWHDLFTVYKPWSYIKNTEPGAEWEMEHESDSCGHGPQSTLCPKSPCDDPCSSHKPCLLQFSRNEQWLFIFWYSKGTGGFGNVSFKSKNAAVCQVLEVGALRVGEQIALTHQELIPAMSELTKSRNNSKKWWI